MATQLGHGKSRSASYSKGPGRTSAAGTKSMGGGAPGRTSMAAPGPAYAGSSINHATGRGTIGAKPSVLPFVAPGNQR